MVSFSQPQRLATDRSAAAKTLKNPSWYQGLSVGIPSAVAGLPSDLFAITQDDAMVKALQGLGILGPTKQDVVDRVVNTGLLNIDDQEAFNLGTGLASDLLAPGLPFAPSGAARAARAIDNVVPEIPSWTDAFTEVATLNRLNSSNPYLYNIAMAKMSEKAYLDIINSRSKQRKKWGDARRNAYLKNKQDLESKRTKRQDKSSDPLIITNRQKEQKLDAYKAYSLGKDYWSKTFSKPIKDGDYYDRQSKHDLVNRANLEAIPRYLKKDGWTIRFASTNSKNQKSSRYLVSPNGDYVVRLSDHDLPNTPEREHNQSLRGTSWDNEITLTGNERPSDVIEQIKNMEKEFSSHL